MQQVEKSNGTPAPAPAEQAVGPRMTPALEPPTPAKRKPPVPLLIVLGLALVGGGIYGVKWVQHSQAYVSTDDAQVAGNLVAISSRVPGHIAQLLVDEGQTVKAGQVVARLDDADFKAALAQAEAALAVARTGLASSHIGVSLQSAQTSTGIVQAESAMHAAEASLDSARANADRAHSDLVRVTHLFEAGGTSKQALEGARTAATAANSAVTAATNQVRSAREAVRLANANTQSVSIKQGGVQTTQAQIAMAQAAVNTAHLQLDHTVITSPVDGTVARRSANVGEQVSPGQGIFSISQTNDVWINAFIEETNIRRVQPGAEVEVRIDAYPKQTFHGRVALVGSATGGSFSLLPQNNAAGNFTKVVQRIPVKVTVEDPNHQLKPGMSADIDIDARGK
jgi:membrane fusion protein (multidrug efflux system)